MSVEGLLVQTGARCWIDGLVDSRMVGLMDQWMSGWAVGQNQKIGSMDYWIDGVGRDARYRTPDGLARTEAR